MARKQKVIKHFNNAKDTTYTLERDPSGRATCKREVVSPGLGLSWPARSSVPLSLDLSHRHTHPQ